MFMARLVFSLLLLGSLVLPVHAASPRNLSAQEAHALLQERKDVYLLDVRTPQEYMEVRIENARLIPIDQLQQRLSELPRDRPILVYCAVGSRSSRVAGQLARLGYPEVYNMFGGVWAWKLRGYPVLEGRP